VSVDYDQKEARFQIKKGEKLQTEQLRKAIADSKRGKMGDVKAAPK